MDGLNEFQVVEDLGSMSYADVAEKHRTSRGSVYKIALRHGARKHERRILERAAERGRIRREFFQEIIDATATSDVLDFLDGIPDESVDAHVTSIPYNADKPYGGGTGDRRGHHVFLYWTLQVLAEMYRALKPGGTMFLQVGSTRRPNGKIVPLDTLLFPHLEDMGFTFQSRVAWTTEHGLTPKNRLSERYETALVMTKGPEHGVFNATPARTPQKNPGKRGYKGPRRGELTGHPLGAWPSNVWHIPTVRHNHPERTGHPAQFPEELARRAVMLYSNPGLVVADVFSGSGTTAAVCKRTGRAFIGCDLFYQDIRAKRLEAISPDMVSWLPGVTDESLAVWQAEARPVVLDAQPVTEAALQLEEQQMHLDLALATGGGRARRRRLPAE